MKWLGFLLIFISCYNFEQGYYSAKLICIFLLGIGLVCSKAIFTYFLVMQRERARANYSRNQKSGGY